MTGQLRCKCGQRTDLKYVDVSKLARRELITSKRKAEKMYGLYMHGRLLTDGHNKGWALYSAFTNYASVC